MVQRIDLDFRRMHYIKIDIIINKNVAIRSNNDCDCHYCRLQLCSASKYVWFGNGCSDSRMFRQCDVLQLLIYDNYCR